MNETKSTKAMIYTLMEESFPFDQCKRYCFHKVQRSSQTSQLLCDITFKIFIRLRNQKVAILVEISDTSALEIVQNDSLKDIEL